MVNYDSHIFRKFNQKLKCFQNSVAFLKYACSASIARPYTGSIYIFDDIHTKSMFRFGVDWLFDTYLHINSIFKCGNMKIELTLSWEHLNYLYEKLNETVDCTHLWWNLSLECAVMVPHWLAIDFHFCLWCYFMHKCYIKWTVISDKFGTR